MERITLIKRKLLALETVHDGSETKALRQTDVAIDRSRGVIELDRDRDTHRHRSIDRSIATIATVEVEVEVAPPPHRGGPTVDLCVNDVYDVDDAMRARARDDAGCGGVFVARDARDDSRDDDDDDDDDDEDDEDEDDGARECGGAPRAIRCGGARGGE